MIGGITLSSRMAAATPRSLTATLQSLAEALLPSRVFLFNLVATTSYSLTTSFQPLVKTVSLDLAAATPRSLAATLQSLAEALLTSGTLSLCLVVTTSYSLTASFQPLVKTVSLDLAAATPRSLTATLQSLAEALLPSRVFLFNLVATTSYSLTTSFQLLVKTLPLGLITMASLRGYVPPRAVTINQ